MPVNRGWFRVYDRHLDSSKILELSLAERGLLMGIWTLASAKDGVVELSPLQLKRRLWMDEWTVEQVKDALDKLKGLGLLEEVEGGIAPSQWIEHQFPNPSDRPESVAERKRKQRSRQNLSGETGGNTPVTASHGNVTASHEIEENRRDETREEEIREETDETRRDESAAPIPTEPDQVSVPSVPSFGTGASSVPSVPEPVRPQPAHRPPEWRLSEADIKSLLKERERWTHQEIEWAIEIGVECGTKPRNAKSVLHASILPEVREGARPARLTASTTSNALPSARDPAIAVDPEAMARLEAGIAERAEQRLRAIAMIEAREREQQNANPK
jgi:hypothetical protein